MIMIRSENGKVLGDFTSLRYETISKDSKPSLYILYGTTICGREYSLTIKKLEEDMIKLMDSIHDHKLKYPNDIMDLRFEGK